MLASSRFDRLAEIRVPTMVLVGSLDLEVVHEAARRVADGIAGARLVNWPDIAHLPSMERPDDFLALLRIGWPCPSRHATETDDMQGTEVVTERSPDTAPTLKGFPFHTRLPLSRDPVEGRRSGTRTPSTSSSKNRPGGLRPRQVEVIGWSPDPASGSPGQKVASSRPGCLVDGRRLSEGRLGLPPSARFLEKGCGVA